MKGTQTMKGKTMKNKYNEYIKHANNVAPNTGLVWYELDNVYNQYSDLKHSANRMMHRLQRHEYSDSPEDQELQELWKNALALEKKFTKMMKSRLEELRADRELIVPIHDHKLIYIQSQNGF